MLDLLNDQRIMKLQILCMDIVEMELNTTNKTIQFCANVSDHGVVTFDGEDEIDQKRISLIIILSTNNCLIIIAQR